MSFAPSLFRQVSREIFLSRAVNLLPISTDHPMKHQPFPRYSGPLQPALGFFFPAFSCTHPLNKVYAFSFLFGGLLHPLHCWTVAPLPVYYCWNISYPQGQYPMSNLSSHFIWSPRQKWSVLCTRRIIGSHKYTLACKNIVCEWVFHLLFEGKVCFLCNWLFLTASTTTKVMYTV